MGDTKAEMERARRILGELIELSGLSRREVERRLLEEGCGTDLGRLLAGRLDLKVRHVLDLVRVLGLHPLEFFRMVFCEPEQRSPFLQRLDALLAPGRAAPATAPRSTTGEIDEIRRRVLELRHEVEILASLVARQRASAPGQEPGSLLRGQHLSGPGHGRLDEGGLSASQDAAVGPQPALATRR